MATTYTWSIDSMSTLPQVNGFTDVVVLCKWLCVGVDGQTSVTTEDFTKITFNSSNPDYIPYSQLTEQKVLEWVFASLGADGVSSIEQSIQGQINSILTPLVSASAQPLPWAGA